MPPDAPGAAVLYASVDELCSRHEDAMRDADLVVLGSHVPDGVEVGEWVLDAADGRPPSTTPTCRYAREARRGRQGARVVERPDHVLWLCPPGGGRPDRAELDAATGGDV